MEKQTLKKAYEFKKKPESEKGFLEKAKEEFKDWYNFNVIQRPKPIK